MKYGMGYSNFGPFVDAGPAVDFAQSVEHAGFESIWAGEHVILPDDYDSVYPYDTTGKMPVTRDVSFPDPLVWLTFVAGATTSLRLGTSILILPQRNPLVLAKEVATLDHLSGGRVELGVGIGWLREEFEALGVSWAGRGRRTDEYIRAMHALWANDGAGFDGEFTSFSKVSSNPKPANGSVPIHIGGHSEAAAARAGRLGDGFFPAADPSTIADLIVVMGEEASAHGRDPEMIEVTTNYPNVDPADAVDAVTELASVGVSRLLVPAFMFFDEERTHSIESFGRQVITETATV